MDGGRIDVQASANAGMLKLVVADTGLGLDASNSVDPAQDGAPNTTHIGLTNVRERLQALYGERASISLTPNTPSGVIAQLMIPL